MSRGSAGTAGDAAVPGALRRLCRTKNHRYRMIGDEGVVVLIERGEVVAVNPLGGRLLELWSEERSLEHVAQAITDEYEVERDVALADAAEFAAQMLELGVLEERTPP